MNLLDCETIFVIVKAYRWQRGRTGETCLHQKQFGLLCTHVQFCHSIDTDYMINPQYT